ncbi:MAG: acyl carrier protein [Chloroflexi bacterium]|nr:MAG: acyl carrier protein [SAR202 cluster bacterium]PKB75149.1 MAG: acyl carrier protein [SAR202 cluster bacterium MP-SAtl-SRR3965592-G2]PKB77439.1 MAG: acyl carrier protein [SAR202 cluster bacterium MP-SInd-SRR3963457-G2]RUA21349.1 MAG: acyl carrier protein [Chloroflexota bacterium]HIM80781.1 acyl carrier protein [Dehalococcoidia bacterium]
MATVYDRVKTIVIDKLGMDESEVGEDSSFVDNLNADSLDLVELIMAFEEEFSTDEKQVEISDDEAGNIGTIKDAVDYLKGHGIADD